MPIDPKEVRGFYVLTPCEFCHEEGRVSGGKYKHEGEVVVCPVCSGTRTVRRTITLHELRKLVLDWNPEED